MTNRYYKSKDIKDKVFFGIPDYITADLSGIAFKEFIVQDGDRLDAIAEQIYGNPNYWREIAIFNNIGYIFDISAGMILNLPVDIKQVSDRL